MIIESGHSTPTLELPFFIGPESLSQQLKSHPGKYLLTIRRAIRENREIAAKAEKFRARMERINYQMLGRRQLFRVTVGGAAEKLRNHLNSPMFAALISTQEAGNKAERDPVEILANEPPWSFSMFFPLREEEARLYGQLTLDQEAGPLHMFDLWNWLINDRETDVRGDWAENITPTIVNLITEKFSDQPQLLPFIWRQVGYCYGVSVSQIRKPMPSLATLRPDPENLQHKIDLAIVTGMYTAVNMGGVADRPNENAKRVKGGPTSEMMENILYFLDLYRQNLPGSDRLPVVEWKPNWSGATVSIDDNGVFKVLDLSNPHQGYKFVHYSQIQSIFLPYSYRDALRLQERGQKKFSHFLMNEFKFFRLTDLDEDVVDEIAEKQRAVS